MEHIKSNLKITILLLIAMPLHAKNCTESDIRNAASSGVAFDYSARGCTNSGGDITISNGIPVNKSNWVFDGKNLAHLVWTGGGSCDRYPRTGYFAFFSVNANKVTLKNFTADGAPEGIHIETGDSNTVDNVVFPIVCEKAIRQGNNRKDAATNTVVKNSKFYTGKGPADHSILVHGGNILVQGNYFKDPRSAVSAGGNNANPGYHPAGVSGVPSYITTENNEVDGCLSFGMQSAGKGAAKGSFLKSQNDTFRNCKTPLRVQEAGFISADNDTFRASCGQAILSITSTATGTYGCGNQNFCNKTISGPGLKTQSACN